VSEGICVEQQGGMTTSRGLWRGQVCGYAKFAWHSLFRVHISISNVVQRNVCTNYGETERKARAIQITKTRALKYVIIASAHTQVITKKESFVLNDVMLKPKLN